MPNPIARWVERRLGRQVDARVQAALKVVDDAVGDRRYWRPANDPSGLQRPWSDIRLQLERIQRVCLGNPLAQRVVGLTTDFVIGSGAELVGSPWALAFWEHPLNALNLRVYRWCDELSRSGELYLVLSTNPLDRMSYVREVPAILIDEIETDPDDLERELRYHQLTSQSEGRWWPGLGASDPVTHVVSPGSASAGAAPSTPDQVMLHYTINRPVGQVRGVSDLAQILTWLERYDLWLEDRVRINRYKGAYLWHVQIQNALPGQLEAKRAQYSRVPNSGSIIVSDASETWSAVQPQIGADDVEADGKALRLMIAAGAGVPLHFLAEGESATRATAREMGVATYRHYAHRQAVFEEILRDVVRTAAARAGEDAGELDIRFESVLTERDRGTGDGARGSGFGARGSGDGD